MNENKNIQNNGGYNPEDLIWHQHSNKLLVKILEFWQDKTIPIFDIGCGHNFYVNVLHHHRYMATGFDWVHFPGVYKMDITKPMTGFEIRDRVNVLSLEVGEHIPAERADGYLDNLTRFGGDVIMSWAIPGQPGIGHINCQTIEWVCSRMFDRGYELSRDKTAQLRASVNGCHCTWFVNTLMYFKPKTA